MPEVDAVLTEKAQAARDNLAQFVLRDPASAIWGRSWTVNYFHICGLVNAKNGFGGYVGQQIYVSSAGSSARMISSNDEAWIGQCIGQEHELLPADQTPA